MEDGTEQQPQKQPRPRAPRVSKEEREKRVELVEAMLARGIKPGAIARHFAAEYQLSTKTVKIRYIPEARKRLVERSGDSKDFHRGAGLEFLQSVKSDPKATVRDKVQAQREINKLLGLHQPTRVDITTGGEPIKGYIGLNPDSDDI